MTLRNLHRTLANVYGGRDFSSEVQELRFLGVVQSLIPNILSLRGVC
jgi:hypothetical protein